MIKLVPLKGNVQLGEVSVKWAVYKGNRLLRVFEDRNDAQDFCVNLQTDMLWERSNRD